MVVGTPQTSKSESFAGLIGVSVGTLLRLFRVLPWHRRRIISELSMLA